jgi:hypothetical protein
MDAVHAPALRDAALRSLVTSQEGGERLGKLLGDAPQTAAGLWKSQVALRDRERREAVLLSSLADLAYPNFLSGEIGQRLAAGGTLVPMYVSHPEMAIAQSDYLRLVAQMEGAQHVAIYTGQVEPFRDAARGVVPDARGIVMATPDTVGVAAGARWDVNLGFPPVFEGRNPVFDPAASFGIWLEQNWVPYMTIGDYTVFHRR